MFAFKFFPSSFPSLQGEKKRLRNYYQSPIHYTRIAAAFNSSRPQFHLLDLLEILMSDRHVDRMGTCMFLCRKGENRQ